MLWNELATIDDWVLVWETDNSLIGASKQKQKLVQFLFGLNETYTYVSFNPKRNSIKKKHVAKP